MKPALAIAVAASLFLTAACGGESAGTAAPSGDDATKSEAPSDGGVVDIKVVTLGGTYEFTSARECILRPDMDAFQFVTTADEAGYEILAYSNMSGLNISFRTDDHKWAMSLPPAEDSSVIDGKRFSYKGDARLDGDRNNLETIEISVTCP